MPLIEAPSRGFIQEARPLLKYAPNTIEQLARQTIALQRLAMQRGVSASGFGCERFVIIHPNDATKIITATYGDKDPQEAKLELYLHNIYNALWPHNFPHIFASSGSSDSKPAIAIKQRIKCWETTEEVVPDPNFPGGKTVTQWPRAIYPFRAVEADCKKWDIPLYCDLFDDNFILGEDGGMYYVDNLFFKPGEHLPEENFLRFVQANGFTQAKIAEISSRIKRLNTLSDMYMAKQPNTNPDIYEPDTTPIGSFSC